MVHNYGSMIVTQEMPSLIILSKILGKSWAVAKTRVPQYQ